MAEPTPAPAWYRGRLTDADGLESVSLAYSTGTQGLLMAWLDGRIKVSRTQLVDQATALFLAVGDAAAAISANRAAAAGQGARRRTRR